MMGECERVMHQLTQLAHDFPAPHELGTLIDLDLSAADLARLVGADETQVGRHLRRLSRDRRIAFVTHPKKRIVVLGLRPGVRPDDGGDDSGYRGATRRRTPYPSIDDDFPGSRSILS